MTDIFDEATMICYNDLLYKHLKNTNSRPRQKEKRVAEDEMVTQYHLLNGYESERSPGDSEGQGSLVCC